MNQVKPRRKLLTSLYFPFFLVLNFIFFPACEEEIIPIELGHVSEIIVQDNGNLGDASDIEVNFKKQLDLGPIKEYRLFAIKSAKAASFDLEAANALSSEFYTQIGKDETYPVRGKKLESGSNDTDGEQINKDQSYRFAILTVATDSKASENTLVISESDFQLRVNNQLRNFTLESEIGAGNLLMSKDGELIMSEYNIQDQVSNNQESKFKIYKITPGGTFEEESEDFKLLAGSFIDANNTLYQSEFFGSRLFKKTASGEILDIVPQGANLFQPDGIYVDENEIIFVVDQEAERVVEILPDGTSSQFAFLSKNPKGITADNDGNLYVSHNDPSGDISKITPDGTVSTLCSIPVSKPEGYELTYKMWIGYIVFHEGSLYVAGMSTDRIYKVSLSGEVSVFAGSGTRGLPRGGAKTANLNRPNGLAFSPDGSKLYISGCTDVTPSHTQYSTPGIIWEIDIVE